MLPVESIDQHRNPLLTCVPETPESPHQNSIDPGAPLPNDGPPPIRAGIPFWLGPRDGSGTGGPNNPPYSSLPRKTSVCTSLSLRPPMKASIVGPEPSPEPVLQTMASCRGSQEKALNCVAPFKRGIPHVNEYVVAVAGRYTVPPG